ncbi:hypothetical protein [Malonomonas rubra]|uniref:hypothetical protein n=1 Tax=Malonomonas rubra TaxID=57040 RepID=UPI0026EB53DB|nr:hypothetical protein [Malonomonas rubra]
MKKTLPVLLTFLLVVYLTALGWTGYGFWTDFSHSQEFSLDPQQPLSVSLQKTASIDLSGHGFTDETRVFMHFDVNNQDAIVGSTPLMSIGHDVHLIGDTLLVGTNGNGLRQVDVSNPLKPKMLETQLQTNSSILDINRHGNNLYASSGKHGLQIFKVLEKGKISPLQRLDTWSMAVASKVVDHYLYVAANMDGLLVYDLNELERKKPIAIVDPGAQVRGVDSYDKYLYVVAGRLGTFIYELDNKGLPLLVGRLADGRSARSVKIIDNHLYLLEQGGVKQYSLANPASPELVVERFYLDSPTELYSFDNEIFVLDSTRGLGRIDWSGNQLGEVAEFVNLGARPMALTKVGSYLYAITADKEVKIIDPKKILPRQTIARIPSPKRISDFLVVEDHLFLTCREGLYSLNLADPGGQLRQLSKGNFIRVTQKEDRLWVSGSRKGVELYDITQPSRPRKVAAWPEIKAFGLEAVGEYLIAGHSVAGVSLHRRLNSVDMKMLDQVSVSNVLHIHEGAGIVAVATAEEGLKFYRIDDGQLSFLSQLKLPFPLADFSEASEFQIVGKTIFVANGKAGLLIVDIENPEKPQLVSSLKLPGFALGLLVENDRVYVAGRYRGLHTVDVSKLDEPKLVDTIAMPAISNRIVSYNGMLYVNNGPLGIEVIPKPIELKVELAAKNKLKVDIPRLNIPGRYSLYVGDNGHASALNSVLDFVEGQNL